MRTDLQWKPQRSFSEALRDTVRWYVDHREWWQSKLSPQPELLPSPSTRPPPAERRGRP
jgi:dTDP-glucose 4,6-dehydratase